MAETAALLVDEVLPRKPLRRWVLSLPFALRFLLATDAEALTRVLGIVYRAISGFILRKAKLTSGAGATGAVTLIQRFGSTLNLNVHLHMLVLDGAFLAGTAPPVFRRIAAPTERELQALVEQIADVTRKRPGSRERNAWLAQALSGAPMPALVDGVRGARARSPLPAKCPRCACQSPDEKTERTRVPEGRFQQTGRVTS